MDTLLAFNVNGALVGDSQGKVTPHRRPTEKSPEQWLYFLRISYQEPDRRGQNEQYIRVSKTGKDKKESLPFATYTYDPVGLSVRAVFDPSERIWVVAGR